MLTDLGVRLVLGLLAHGGEELGPQLAHVGGHAHACHGLRAVGGPHGRRQLPLTRRVDEPHKDAGALLVDLDAVGLRMRGAAAAAATAAGTGPCACGRRASRCGRHGAHALARWASKANPHPPHPQLLHHHAVHVALVGKLLRAAQTVRRETPQANTSRVVLARLHTWHSLYSWQTGTGRARASGTGQRAGCCGTLRPRPNGARRRPARTDLDDVARGHALEERQVVDARGHEGAGALKHGHHAPPGRAAAARRRDQQPASDTAHHATYALSKRTAASMAPLQAPLRPHARRCAWRPSACRVAAQGLWSRRVGVAHAHAGTCRRRPARPPAGARAGSGRVCAARGAPDVDEQRQARLVHHVCKVLVAVQPARRRQARRHVVLERDLFVVSK